MSSCSLPFKGFKHQSDSCSHPLLLLTTCWNKKRARMDDALSFYDEFYSYYGIQVPPVQTAPPSLPPHPGVSHMRPPPPIPFHSMPTSFCHWYRHLSSNLGTLSMLKSPLLLCLFHPLTHCPPTPSFAQNSPLVTMDRRHPLPLPLASPTSGAAPVMGALTQDQLLQVLNMHFYNTNQILDQLQIHAATAPVAAAAPTTKKYIMLPEGFDGSPKHWCVFKGQCGMYVHRFPG